MSKKMISLISMIFLMGSVSSLIALTPDVTTPVENVQSFGITPLERMWEQVNQSYRMDWMPPLNTVQRFKDLNGNYNDVVSNDPRNSKRFRFEREWNQWTMTCVQRAAAVLGDRTRAVAITEGVDATTREARTQAAVQMGIRQCQEIRDFAERASNGEVN